MRDVGAYFIAFKLYRVDFAEYQTFCRKTEVFGKSKQTSSGWRNWRWDEELKGFGDRRGA